MSAYTEKDFVEVFDEAGVSQGNVPKKWVGTDLLPDGVKPKGRTGGGNSRSSQSDAEKKAAEEAKAKAEAEAAAKAEAEKKAADAAKAKAENTTKNG